MFAPEPLARIFTSFRSEAREKALDTTEDQRAEAYLDSTLSTVSERNEVDTALSRAAVERCEICGLATMLFT
jgi:hypothetical protein